MPSVFGCNCSGSRCGNGPNELVHRLGLPFLDNHYHGYQYSVFYMVNWGLSTQVRGASDQFGDIEKSSLEEALIDNLLNFAGTPKVINFSTNHHYHVHIGY